MQETCGRRTECFLCDLNAPKVADFSIPLPVQLGQTDKFVSCSKIEARRKNSGPLRPARVCISAMAAIRIHPYPSTPPVSDAASTTENRAAQVVSALSNCSLSFRESSSLSAWCCVWLAQVTLLKFPQTSRNQIISVSASSRKLP